MEPRGQLGLPGMPAPLFVATPTRLTTWLDCPRRYRFTYLDRPRPPAGPPWAHHSVGAAVHSALADWFGLQPPARTPAAGAELVRRRWLTDGFPGPELAQTWRERWANRVMAYLTGVDPAREPVGIERTVAARTKTLALSGRVDRLDARPGPDGDEDLAVVDYKTGRRPPSADDARTSLALGLYAVAASRTLRRRCSTVELHHLGDGLVGGHLVGATHDEESLQRKVSEAESIAQDAARAHAAFASGDTGDAAFPARPSSLCSWCDFRGSCPQGQAAAPAVDPWAGLG